jgi:hypothetical protein
VLHQAFISAPHQHKEKLQTYCATQYARSGVNQICIIKHSKELLENLKAQTSFK